jgi:flavin reductase (DIM6/NTAB) family NADH-FMN oxidoreductase RutF
MAGGSRAGVRAGVADTGAIDAELFKAAMALVVAPVTVVTAMAGRRPHGTTVSAFSALSLNPPMVSVALDRSSELLKIVRSTRRMGVNILRHEQSGHAVRFACKGGDKFEGVAWVEEHGLPRLLDAPTWLVCDVERCVSGGDHILVLARVASADAAPAPPLAYLNRRYGTHAESPI